MPMLKKYPVKNAQDQELKMSPQASTINAILNYSKSLEVKKVNNEKVLVHLN